MDNYLNQLLNHKRFGVGIVSSGTSGDKKLIHRTPDNLKSCNEVAIESQELTKASKILTVTNMSHAGGLLLQTLPAYTLGCKVIDVEKFNAFNFLKKVKGYTHTFLTPEQMTAVMMTKGFKDCDLRGIRILAGSNPVSWEMIEGFVSKGAIVQPNWGMSEVGPTAINITFKHMWHVKETKFLTPKGYTILGDTSYCSWRLSDELEIKGDISITPNEWLKTGDIVKNKSKILWYSGRK